MDSIAVGKAVENAYDKEKEVGIGQIFVVRNTAMSLPLILLVTITVLSNRLTWTSSMDSKVSGSRRYGTNRKEDCYL